MNKFKVGDKVKLKSLEEIRKIDKDLYGIINKDLKKMQGKVYTIEYICEDGDCLLSEDVAYWFKSDFLVKADIFFGIMLSINFSGTLVIEKGKIVKMEKKEDILNEVEKEYLRAVIKPFRKSITYIKKETAIDKEYIELGLDYDVIDLPYFKKGKMYKGMKEDKEYTLEELGL